MHAYCLIYCIANFLSTFAPVLEGIDGVELEAVSCTSVKGVVLRTHIVHYAYKRILKFLYTRKIHTHMISPGPAERMRVKVSIFSEAGACRWKVMALPTSPAKKAQKIIT